ncbi:MAG: hypothetical protein NTX45_01080 [Proteobacteria bacterium]|nr:hypothetical protein [Pseudomonadota bacterium]
MNPWFRKLDNTDSLEQGDIFYNIPVIEPISADIDRGERLRVKVIKLDIIVLSQSCDLGAGKIQNVTVCPVTNLQLHLINNFGSVSERKAHVKRLKRGEEVRYHLLNKDTGVCEEYLVIDLKNAYGINYDLLDKLRESQPNRIGLKPPYREHLSQAFARVYMRIGLPNDILEDDLLKVASEIG